MARDDIRPDAAIKTFDSIDVGDRWEHSIQFDQDKIDLFARLTGDANPLHLDANFAAGTKFGGINVQGQFLSSCIVGVIGSHLPGAGWCCVGVDANFTAPCWPTDGMTIEIEAIRKFAPAEVIVWKAVGKRYGTGDVLLRCEIKTKFILRD